MRSWLRFAALVVAAVAAVLGIRWWRTATSGATAAHPVPARAYGAGGARFAVAFGAPPTARWVDRAGAPNRNLENMVASGSLYVAPLGASAYEDVEVARFPHRLSAGNVHWYLRHWLFGYHPMNWHHLPGASYDVACHLGDSSASCPGRIAELVVIAGNVIYDLGTERASEAEVHRFFDSFGLPGRA